MTECWSEGELRAYYDRELTAEAQARLSEHLEGCAGCAARYREISERAARVTEWIGSLPEPASKKIPISLPARKAASRLWPVISGTLAAGLAIGAWLMPKRVDAPATTPAPPVAPAVAASVAPPAPVVPVRITPAPVVRRRARPAPARRPAANYLALDDDPIDTGVVMRVALGNDNVLADVIYSADGRPRAIRLVSDKGRY